MENNVSHTRIKKLSPLLINQLAAGEVVTRPSAVVKELLENAIDAGATNIEVRITQGGMGMIEVVDNGEGIHPDDMVMALTRHATSKVADIVNLQGITTLGFRGEALSATAAVSRLTLISSHDDSGIGRQLHVTGVLVDSPKLTPVVHNRGTTVIVKDLYFNVPARRGNLKSIATEFNHIETIVREVAIARADITLSLFHDNKRRLLLSASLAENSAFKSNSRLPLSRLEQALGSSLSNHALEIALDLSSLLQQLPVVNDSTLINDKAANISGWLWPVPDSHNTLPKLLYINGRLVKEPLISNQLRQLASNAQLESMGYALYFELPYHWLNINVHPTKQRIKISPLNNVMAHLSHHIRLKLKSLVIPQSMATITTLKQASDKKYLERNDIGDDPSFKAVSSRQQVQSPKQKYQHSTPKKRIEKLSYFNDDNKTPINNLNSNSTNSNSVNSYDGSIITTDILPQCLEVIASIPKSEQLALIFNTDSKKLPTMPWLLFHYQGQYVLIGEQDWQVNVMTLFGLLPFEELILSVSATMINRQILNAVAQLSEKNMTELTANFEQLLMKRAFARINTQQLLVLMLSSAPV